MTIRAGAASLLLAATTIHAWPTFAEFSPDTRFQFDLPSQDMDTTLRAIAKISGRQIMIATGAVDGKIAPPLHGRFTATEAVSLILTGSGVASQLDADTILVGMPARSTAADGLDNDIVVTGSRLKRAPSASPKIVLSTGDIKNGGFYDAGAALRSLPQNFGGGQNPGVTTGASAGGLANQNITGGSAPNLRGLGPDATLTLVNGSRMSYGGLVPGVDISGIPLEAVDHIDVITDGASAIYGSDAVAGVVNLVLKTRYEGVTASTRLGAATDGGDFSQQYDLVGGAHGDWGSVLAAYDYRHNDAIQATQRSYTAYLGQPYTLLPSQRSHSGLLSLSLTPFAGFKFKNDLIINDQVTSIDQQYGAIRYVTSPHHQVINDTASLIYDLDSNWTITASGTASRDATNRLTRAYYKGALVANLKDCYCSHLYGGEVYTTGTLIALPGGPLNLAIGGGYRANRYADIDRAAGSGYGGQQADRFGYAELSIPIFSAANRSPIGRSLSITAAGRFDDYDGFRGIGTPKVGLAYAPIEDLDLLFSWGKSFKAPTLDEQFSPPMASLVSAQSIIGSGATPSQTALLLYGGGGKLKPERATSVSWTAKAHPTAIKGLEVDLTYYRVNYAQRIIQPIGSYTDALNPVYSAYLTTSPSPSMVLADIQSAVQPLDNSSGQDFDAANVAYIIDNRYTNVTRQKIQGVDALISYRRPLSGGELATSLNMGWIESRQKNLGLSSYFDLSGTLWNVPRTRLRYSLGWEGSSITAYAFLNYAAGLKDNRVAPAEHLRSMTTVDLSFNYRPSSTTSLLKGLDLGVNVSNLFDERPPYLAPALYTVPYDSTNYSAIGRFVSVSLAKHF